MKMELQESKTLVVKIIEGLRRKSKPSKRVPFARFFLYLGLNFQFRLVLQLKTLAEAAVLTVNCDSGVF
ncbi:hypothetical protein Peur_042320 [Populus x canadensis]